MRVGQGGQITLEANFTNTSGGALVFQSGPTVDIHNPDGVVVSAGLIPVQVDADTWRVTWTAPIDAVLGWWTAQWQGTVDGFSVGGTESFEVTEPALFSPSNDVLRLRELLGERIPTGGQDTDTFFTDEQLTDLIQTAPSMAGATAIGWAMKAAEYVKFVDINESGSQRALSQRYRAAIQMVKYWAARADAEDVMESGGRVVGRVAQILRADNRSLVLLNELIGPEPATQVRPYPTFRMHSILG